jgi:hypothetical protein
VRSLKWIGQGVLNLQRDIRKIALKSRTIWWIKSHNSGMKIRNFTPIHFKLSIVIGIDSIMVCILFGEISIFLSRVVGFYSSNCKRFFVCRVVNWEPVGQFTSNFAQLLELIVLRSAYFLVKFRFFFFQELWERKSLQILYECWRRAYQALLAQLFI